LVDPDSLRFFGPQVRLLQDACGIAERHSAGGWREFPQRSFAMALNSRRRWQQIPLLAHRLLGSMFYMAGKLIGTCFTAQHRARLCKCGGRAQKTYENQYILHPLSPK